MHVHETKTAQEIALARFAVIAPLVVRHLSNPETRAVRRTILDQVHAFPGEKTRKISDRTLRRWVEAYRKALPEGTLAALEALYRLERSDKGEPRVFDRGQVEEAVALRLELAERSTSDILAHFKEPPKEATLAYHLRKRGATRVKVKAQGKAFPRYEADAVNAIWQSDVMDGFYLPDPTDPERFKEVHLMGFMDDHSRLVTHAEWYFRESLPCLFDCLKKAVIRHGCPTVLYWDNGPCYKSAQVQLVAARLGAQVVYSTPYAPQGKGKIERFWRSVSRSFLTEANHAGIPTLEALNQAFWAWLHRYNNREHRSTKATPCDRWAAGASGVRYPDPATIHEIFLWEESRLVKKTGTLSLAGNEYRVDDTWVGKTVEVRYDPLDLATVRVYQDGSFLQIAEPYQLVAHTHRKATPHKKDDKYLPLPSSKRLLEAAVADRQAAIDEAVADVVGPQVGPHHPDRLDSGELQALFAQTLARTLNEAERVAIDRHLRRYAPLSREWVTLALAAVVETKGTDRHLDYYLGEIRPTQGGRP